MHDTPRQKNIKLPETIELLQSMRIPHQKPEHPDHWITEAIDLLLEPDRDQPKIGRYLENNKTKTITRSTKPKIQTCAEKISTYISPQDFIKGFKYWKETKASSPSGRHIGHYKALSEDTNIIAFFCKMLRLPLKHGFAPTRWKKVLQIVISKDEGQPKVDRLRNILLLEADYNFVLKLIWGKRLMQRATRQQLLHTAQHARPKNLATSASLNKKITYDIIRQMKIMATSFDNDAKGCYDFIVPPHAMIACQRLGLTPKAAEMLTKILQGTKYLLKTGHGQAKTTYGTTNLYRILGIGQGSGGASCAWTSLLDTILWSVSEKYDSLIIESPVKELIKRLGDAFVDDTSQMTTNDPKHHPEDFTKTAELLEHLIIKTTQIAQDFEKKLNATGGYLALTKCFWYLISWEWDSKGEATMSPISKNPSDIYLTSGQNTEIKHKIHRAEVTTPYKTIGSYQTPTGCMKKRNTNKKRYNRKMGTTSTNKYHISKSNTQSI